MLKNHEGQRVPTVVFKTRKNDEFVDITSDEIFKGRTVIVFSLPGAFTPTCSSTHLPRFNELARCSGKMVLMTSFACPLTMPLSWMPGNRIRKRRILLLSLTAMVNLPRLWVCWLTRETLVSVSVHGVILCWLGTVSSRSSLLKPRVEGDPFEVSDADTMIDYINPSAANQMIRQYYYPARLPLLCTCKVDDE